MAKFNALEHHSEILNSWKLVAKSLSNSISVVKTISANQLVIKSLSKIRLVKI